MEGLVSLARSFSHALNNILTASQGNLALLQHAIPSDPAELHAMLADISTALEGAQRLALQLAAISYWQPFKACRIDTRDFLLHHEAGMRALLGDDRPFVLDISDDLLAIQVDPHSLELALNALVIHASSDRGSEEPLRLCCRIVATDQLADGLSQRMVMIGVALSEDAIPRSETEQALQPGISMTKSPISALGLRLVRQFALACRGDVRVKVGAHLGYQVDLVLPAMTDTE